MFRFRVSRETLEGAAILCGIVIVFLLFCVAMTVFFHYLSEGILLSLEK